jgi:UDP-MurNAc hydroxylase
MVYRYSEKEMREIGKKKRDNEMARATRYIEQLKATYVIPSAGPAAFLDDELFHLNDFDRDPSNTFPDQATFVDYLNERGHHGGRVMIPGSVMKLGHDANAEGRCEVTHPVTDEELHAIFHDKRRYLEGYKARKKPLIDAIKATWPRGKVNILSSLRTWFEPLLAIADLTCVGVNSKVLLDCGEGSLDGRVVIDFQKRKVYPFAGEECDYAFFVDRSLVEYCILNREEDWVNTLFLSCRFEAARKGPFNEYVYGFFKCLSPARLAVAEAYYAEKAPAQQQLMELEGHVVQRRCPHLKVDLAKFGHVENGVLTCSLHGWQFEVASGKCLTSDGYRLYSRAIDPMEKGRRRRTLEVHEPAAAEADEQSAAELVVAEAPCSEVKLAVPAKRRARKSA